jgi:hypothetical protein
MSFFTTLYNGLSILPENVTLDIIKKYITPRDLDKFLSKVKKEVNYKRNYLDTYIHFDIYKNKKSKKLSKKEYNNKIKNKNRIKDKKISIDIGTEYILDNLINCECENCFVLSKKINM